MVGWPPTAAQVKISCSRKPPDPPCSSSLSSSPPPPNCIDHFRAVGVAVIVVFAISLLAARRSWERIVFWIIEARETGFRYSLRRSGSLAGER